MRRQQKTLSETQKKAKAEYARKWRLDNPERVREHSRRSRLKNPQRRKQISAEWRERNRSHLRKTAIDYYYRNRDHIRDLFLRKRFGITSDQFDRMLRRQKGVCGLCKGPPGARQFAVDHDHVSGSVRGLLCRGCNVGIGNLKDDPKLLEKAAGYIRKHRGKKK